jgi:pyruvate kinase
MGRYPVSATAMLAEIAAATEPHRQRTPFDARAPHDADQAELIARSIHHAVNSLDPVAVVVPTRSGHMARSVTRFRLPAWIIAFSKDVNTCQALQFSYGVHAVRVESDAADWTPFLRQWSRERGLTSGLAVLAQGPSPENPCGNHRMEIVDLSL